MSNLPLSAANNTGVVILLDFVTANGAAPYFNRITIVSKLMFFLIARCKGCKPSLPTSESISAPAANSVEVVEQCPCLMAACNAGDKDNRGICCDRCPSAFRKRMPLASASRLMKTVRRLPELISITRLKESAHGITKQQTLGMKENTKRGGHSERRLSISVME